MANKNTGSLSFSNALLITINTMFGSGVFINTVYLINMTGFFGFVSYGIIAFILSPLIVAMSVLTRLYPTGGFYQYAAQGLGTFWGFLSAWLYFVGKLASATLLIHVFVTIIQNVFPVTSSISTAFLDIAILTFFIGINYFGLKLGSRVITIFFILKIIPALFMIFAGLYLFKHWQFGSSPVDWHTIPTTLPSVLYAFLGFETACSISLHIQNSAKNTPRIIIGSFLFTIIITILYQLMAFLVVGSLMVQHNSFLDLFPKTFSVLWPTFGAWHYIALDLIHLAAACAALGGSYGIIFSNAWNLYILAQNNHIFFANQFTRKNRFEVPFLCFIVEGVICLIYFMLTAGQQVILQQISVLGCTLTFCLSVLALYNVHTKMEGCKKELVIGALISCFVLLAGCIRNVLFAKTVIPALGFGILTVAGIFMYMLCSKK